MNSRIIESKEAARCLSDVRMGIDLGYIKNVSKTILNELMILTQPGFLQAYAGGTLRPFECDVRRAALIRERLMLDHQSLKVVYRCYLDDSQNEPKRFLHYRRKKQCGSITQMWVLNIYYSDLLGKGKVLQQSL